MTQKSLALLLYVGVRRKRSIYNERCATFGVCYATIFTNAPREKLVYSPFSIFFLNFYKNHRLAPPTDDTRVDAHNTVVLYTEEKNGDTTLSSAALGVDKQIFET